jgi:HAD superfamily hydrolase (TIGR01450 family)
MESFGSLSRCAEIDMASLIDGYSCLLLDAYGVLLDKSGPLPGATALIAYLNAINKPYYILSNSASTLPEHMAAMLADLGLPIPQRRLITAGVLLLPYFQRHGLVGRRCIALGTQDSLAYVLRAGGIVVSPDISGSADAVIIADQAGFPFLEALDNTLSVVLRQLDRREPIHLVLCNPDLIYPRAPGRFGFTAGGLAVMLEGALRERYPESSYGFVRLGKPFQAMFEEAVTRGGTRNMVMIGDQLTTDVLGANQFGIDSVLINTGLGGGTRTIPRGRAFVPTYVLPSLHLPL